MSTDNKQEHPQHPHPAEEQSKRKAQKLENLNTRGKNAAGQTNGQFEQDTRARSGNFEGAGQAPRRQP